MHKGPKKSRNTEKSSMVRSFKYYKNKGLQVNEIAKKLQINLSTAKKISAGLDRKKSEKQRILEKFTNPYIDLKLLNLNDLQRDILYKSKEWLTQIKPLRVITELKNNPRADYEKVIRNLSIETLDALEENFSDEWAKTLTIRKEFKEFKRKLPGIKKELESIKISADMYVCYSTFPDNIVNISDLKEFKNMIPQEERYPLPRSITKRFMIPEGVAIMHDAKYLQISNDINILENKITRRRVAILQEYIADLNEGTKRLIKIYLKSPVLNNELKMFKDDKDFWIGIDQFFEEQEEKNTVLDYKSECSGDIEHSFAYEEILELQNQAFVSGCGKRAGKMGSNRTGQKMAYAINLLK